MSVSVRKFARVAWVAFVSSVLTIQVVIIVSSLAGTPLLDPRFLPLYLCVLALTAAAYHWELKRKEAKPEAVIDGRESLRRVIEAILAHDRGAQQPLLRAVEVMSEEDARRVLASLAVGLMERPEIESALRKAHELQELEEESK